MSLESLVDLELERAFLGHVLRRPADLRRVEHLPQAGDFGIGEHRAIWSVVSDMDASETPAGFEIVTAELRRRAAPKAASYCDELASSAHSQSSDMVAALCTRIREMSEHRRVVERLQRASAAAASAASATEARALAEEALFEGDVGYQGLVPMIDVAHEVIEEARSGEDASLAAETGIDALDSALGGGLRRGHVTVVAARPGMGKSAFASSVASYAVLKGQSAAVFSLEMTRKDWGRRVIQSLSKATAGELGLTSGDHVCDRVDMAMKFLSDAGKRYVVEDQAGMAVEDIASACRSHKRRHGLDLVVVDYAQLAKTRKKTGTREREVAEVSLGLLAIAKSLDCAMVAVAQLNRGVESRPNKRPTVGDLRDSGQLEQDAHEIVMLYRHAHYHEVPDYFRSVTELHLVKSRTTAPTAPETPVLATFQGNIMRWQDTPGSVATPYFSEVRL